MLGSVSSRTISTGVSEVPFQRLLKLSMGSEFNNELYQRYVRSWILYYNITEEKRLKI